MFTITFKANRIAISSPMYVLRWVVDPMHLVIVYDFEAAAIATLPFRAEASVKNGRQ